MELLTTIQRLFRRDDGQDLLEYGLLASLIAAVAVGTLSSFGDKVTEWWLGVKDLF